MAQTRSSNNSRSNSSRNNTGNRNSSTRRTTSNSTRSSSKNSKNSTSNRTKKNTVTSAEASSLSFLDYWHAFSKTRFFKPVMTVLVLVVLVLLDLLFAWNHFDRFFTILGIEILLVSAAFVILLFFSISTDKSGDVPTMNTSEKE